MKKLDVKQREVTNLFFNELFTLDKSFVLRTDLTDLLKKHVKIDQTNPFYEIINNAQEAVVRKPWIYFATRPDIGVWEYVKVHTELTECEHIESSEFLHFKENLVEDKPLDLEDWVLELDFKPFNRDFPVLKEKRSIGRGVEFLNRKLSSKLFDNNSEGMSLLYNFLRLHKYQGTQLMLNKRVKDVSQLQTVLRKAETILSKKKPKQTWQTVEADLNLLGFEPGWGRTIQRIRETMNLLSDILEAPSPLDLEHFLGRIPMMFSCVIITPHGFFGQSDVLGKPDTGGQVVYILDQARAMEEEMKRQIYDQGLDIEPKILIVTRLIPDAQGTNCDCELENVMGCSCSRILRVPFRDELGQIIPNWISRFDIWPHLERYAKDVEKEIVYLLEGKPDLIIGNYSDGNLVASLLSKSFHVIQCNIAHALEKTKYLYSAIYWKESDSTYHFSCQFTADLIAMNCADFIITSTYQEIAGTDETVGQYESYNTFTMPGLYRVLNGVNVYDPKFNIISPGVDTRFFFPYFNEKERSAKQLENIKELVFGEEIDCEAKGILLDQKKPILFAMARLDCIKNLASLVEWFGENERLREKANLLLVAGHIDVTRSSDSEEISQIKRMHELIEKYDLGTQLRWLTSKHDKNITGELYRFIADGRGAFIQPAHFEAFGLTIIEAMSSGLPTFATCYGGPLEIIEDGVSGFHIDPNNGEESTKVILDFINKSKKSPAYWDKISKQGLKRVKEKYTWQLYAKKALTLSKIYGFWKYITNLERLETHRYLEMFYGSVYRPLVKKMLDKD